MYVYIHDKWYTSPQWTCIVRGALGFHLGQKMRIKHIWRKAESFSAKWIHQASAAIFFFFQRIQIPLSWGQHLPLYLLYVSPPQTFISWHLREDYNTQRRNRVVTAPLSQQDPSIRWDSSTFTHLRELPETEYKSRTEREKVLSVWTWNMPNVQSHI